MTSFSRDVYLSSLGLLREADLEDLW